MKLLGSRVDALTLTARVGLERSLVAKLKETDEKARGHGRARFDFSSVEPDTGMGRSTERKLGPHRMRWASEADKVARIPRIWGELKRTERRGVWIITNEPYFRLQIREHGQKRPNLGDTRKCSGCGGTGRAAAAASFALVPEWGNLFRGDVAAQYHRSHETKEKRCERCDGTGAEDVPGFTFEIIFYAQELARSGLEFCLREAEAIAAMCGEVEELRLGRIDLCADVEGWTIAEEDAKLVAKRARADLGVWDGRAANDADQQKLRPPACGPKCRYACVCRNVRTHETGGFQRRRITGISVGSGGAIMSRIYDKRVEMERDQSESGNLRRAAEEERWTASGWDGVTSVTRVEFQIRGVALTELGIRDPDACMVPLFKTETVRKRGGVERTRIVLAGQHILTVEKDGKTVQATLVDRLEAIWRTCLEWVRLVKPAFTRSGEPVQVSRLEDDPRWELLREARFDDRVALPIKRYRPRASASAAQALGVMLSQAGRDGRLREMVEDREAYEELVQAEEKLLRRLRALARFEASRMYDHLLVRYGGVVGAWEHLAIRSNAARTRFYAGYDGRVHAARPPPVERDVATAKVA